VYESQRLDNYAVADNVKGKIESDILQGREYDSRLPIKKMLFDDNNRNNRAGRVHKS
jgi:hypothetical protein